MGINKKCPKCGSEKVQLSNESNRHGCLFTLLFGVWYLLVVFIRWMIGLMLFVCIDWWMAIIKAASKKGYVWKSKQLFSGKKKIYYCHDCGHNFRA
ncbi:MAG: hypothetical protein E7443_01425 [Ruminococcaceae bacterium]|nr:hypothetical protein [Oscillospiraceae bacterium]